MIRFALVVASVLGFVLTAALGNMMVPLLRELQRAARGTQPDSDAPDSPVPTMGGLCLMVGTLAAVGRHPFSASRPSTSAAAMHSSARRCVRRRPRPKPFG